MELFSLCVALLLMAVQRAMSASLAVERRQDTSSPYLNQNITAKGKLWFGTAIDTTRGVLNNAAYMTVFNDSRIFGGATPANTMKWGFTEPQQNQFTLAAGNQTLNVAHATGKKVRCHNLVWYVDLPAWVQNGPWTNKTLTAAMGNHITTLITKYGRGCYSWDVVNEAFLDNGNFVENVIGEAYVPIAFQYANAAVQSIGGGVKLYYNEYGADVPGPKQQAVVNMVKRIQATSGAHIDGVGLESHQNTTSYATPNQRIAALSSYTALGVDVAITELDVACSATPCSAADLKLQARIYYDTTIACMQTARCVGVTVWDFDDQYSYQAPGTPCLYYGNLTRHPAYIATAQAIYQWDCSVC